MSAVNFQKGDVVCLRDDLKTHYVYGGWNLNSDMAKHKGEFFTIQRVCGDHYSIAGFSWGWTDEMFEPAGILPEKNDRNDFKDKLSGVETSVEALLSLYKS